jgi:signal transduction histidine kinase
MLYDALCLKKPYISLLSLTALVNISEFDYIQLELNLAGILISLLLFFRTSELKKYVLLLHETRDSSAQANMTLKQKNKQLMEQQDNEIYLATLKERNRIAREIHDNVGHMLTRSLLQIGALIIVTKDETQNQALSGIKDTLDSAMTSIRTSVHNLHDNSIDLKQAACECIKSIETKFTVAFDFDISYNTPKNIKLCIIGVLKESLSNIAKHCSGNNVKISIIEHPKFYQLSVKDNGCCKEISSDGMGLINMRERAENLNGIINFTPSDKGFTVFMSIPKP